MLFTGQIWSAPRRWRIAGAVAGAILAAVFLGCMSLNIGCRDSDGSSSVGVTTDASGVVKQEGKITLAPGCSQQVFYPICYCSVPNLELRESGCFAKKLVPTIRRTGSPSWKRSSYKKKRPVP